VSPTRARLGTIAIAAAALVSCSLLTRLDDPTTGPGHDGGSADTASPEDGGSADATLPVDAGEDAAPTQDGSGSNLCTTLESGALCAYAGGCQCSYCQAGSCSTTMGCPEGFNWEAGNDLARCCSGLAVLTDTNENCGVCGIHCATAGVTSAQDCALLSGHYQCVNCAANSECWSGCCAIDTTPNHCSESDCNTGACVAGLCPAPATCTPGAGGPNYCSY
jgi:hypothetical protein